MHTRNSVRPPSDLHWVKVFTMCFGLVLGLACLKFPNPPVLEYLSTTPASAWEWALMSWPVKYGYPLVGLLALAGLPLLRWPGGLKPHEILLPAGWLIWIWFTCFRSIVPELSRITCVHFTIGIVCFYLGLLVAGRLPRPARLLTALLLAFVLVLAVGWEQHFGGLAASQNYFKTYVLPTQESVAPEMLKRMESTRIFATLFYPNSLAGLLLLLAPALLGLIAETDRWFTVGARRLLTGVLAVGVLGCMIWSGSKTGWLLSLAMVVAAFWRCRVQRRLKLGITLGLLVVGLVGFLVRYHGFFERGATSVVARFDYWSAAANNVLAHPGVGSGPGSFAKVYGRVRAPDSEMARLVHNDYLQQASDSGLVGGLLFLALVGLVLWRGRWAWGDQSWAVFGVILGLAGFAVQSLVEFGFYVPATSWCWFGLAGWLVAQSGLKFDNSKATS